MKTKSIKKLITTHLTTTAVAVGVLSSMAVNAAEYKHVAVAPEQINAQKMPSAQTKGIFSHSTMLPIFTSALSAVSDKAGKNLNIQEFEQKIHLDGPMTSPIVLLTPDAEQWFISVTNPSGKQVYNELTSASKQLAVSDIQVGSQSFKGKTFSLQNPVAGQWSIKLTRKSDSSSKVTASASKDIAGYLLFKGDSNLQAYSYLDTNITTQNNDINIVAHMADTSLDRGERQLMVKKEPLRNSIDSAVATIKTPSGQYLTIALNDDGVQGDAVAGDGQFGAQMPSDEVGVYTNQVQINGRHPDGKRFSRTTTDIYPIAAASFSFSDAPARLTQVDNTSALLSVPVKHHDNSEAVFLAAEVWGTNADGKPQSAAWAGGIVTPKDSNKDTVLELAFDTRWLTRANLKAPYTLKSLRLQTVDNNVPLAQRDELSLKSSAKLTKQLAQSAMSGQNLNSEITTEMLMGKAPARTTTATTSKAAPVSNAAAPTGGPALLLVHGYCSGQAWKESDFYNSAEFKDYKQSISHNTFAQRVANFGNAYSSYGIVAHSQGGAAALQLYAKFWSGLDDASSGSLIQSVGTPYQGTALAGNLAAIGDVFGAGCGTNTDLTYNGASNWLSTIPTWARNKVEYYTTSFDTAWWRYDYCHLATDLFLDDPEDGTTEKWSGQLSGGINKGHKTGQCHTSGMRDPAQTKDSGRNSSMSSRAAR